MGLRLAFPRYRAVSQRALVLLSRTDMGPVGSYRQSQGSCAPGRDILVGGLEVLKRVLPGGGLTRSSLLFAPWLSAP